ncbi:hypothetical protein SRABI26_01897 [Arthrobacter sp. Bi26]|uniref:hypothetical protein n=1 Tax=Arthrobacter sp. Bi26 TaxID=2822350 RepID=UPI001D9B8B31|nr:hypothetical protein [Arthrobacter sp. Bi26]CAH0200235.1 hypothetical protein SRABI26_01897 [Arthrobacter sp. Bi26]
MIAAAAEEFATVEECFRCRYPFDESYKNLAVVVEGEEGQVTMGWDVQGSVLNVLPVTSYWATTTSLTSASASKKQHLAQIRVFGVTVAKKTLETE